MILLLKSISRGLFEKNMKQQRNFTGLLKMLEGVRFSFRNHFIKVKVHIKRVSYSIKKKKKAKV